MGKTRGRNASLFGRHNEDTFEAKLVDCGYGESCDTHNLRTHSFTKQFPFNHPWKKRGKGDFLLRTPGDVLVLVQNKTQNKSGTTDEKIPFQFDVARWSLTELQFDEFWMVLGGVFWATPQGGVRVEAYKKKAKETDVLAMERMKSRVFLQNDKGLSFHLRLNHQ